MTPDVAVPARELLLDFAAHLNLQSQVPGGDTAAFRERIVDGFLVTRQPGFAGYSDEELKGVARDAEPEPDLGTGPGGEQVRGADPLGPGPGYERDEFEA